MTIARILFLTVAVAAGGWFFLQKFELQGLDQVRVEKREAGSGTEIIDALPPVKHRGPAIRIASFNIQVFGASKSRKERVMDILARIARQFDVLAIQEIRAKNQDIIPRYVELINSAGREYDYMIGPRLGRTSSKEQYAFIFDRASIEVDRRQLYTVDDPDDLLHREPLVGWFRVRGPPTDQAFTFTLINIHTDPDEIDQELDVLDDVFQAVRDDGRGEDDVILLGDVNVDDKHLGELGQIPEITWVISQTPTNTRQTSQYDNVVFHGRATTEFTGQAGVLDFMRRFNLTMDEALEVSDHMPVWCEFSIYEGGEPGRVATRPGPTRN